MEVINSQPTVTVSVATYNSSKYVIETLESIKRQTWKNLILQVSDDCSTDDTIDICRKWIETNKDRFVETRILTVDHNTGITANSNRAWDACTTEFVKGIAGDDLLLPNCIEDNMAYIRDHPDAVFVFSRAKVFGVSRVRCEQHEKKVFDYSFFQMSPEEQFDRIKYASCLPAASAFCNIKKIREIGLRHDERIPLLEDRPKWLTVIRKGIKFHFFDKETVMYRLHEKSLSNTTILSPKFYESTRLAFFYYVFQDMYTKDPETAIREAVRLEMQLYSRLVDSINKRDRYYKLSLYRLLNIPKSVIIRTRKLLHLK